MKKLNKENVLEAEEQKTLDQPRRDFIKTSTLIGVGVATAAVLPGSATANVSVNQKGSAQQKGYQVSQHVIDYYKSAAI